MDRERLLDMEHRLRPVRTVAMAILALALLVSIPWIGVWTFVPLIFAAGLFELAERQMERSERPEYLIFAAWAGSELTIAAAVALSGGPATATLSWIAIPVVTLSARFSLRGVIAGVAIALGLVLAVAFGVHGQAVVDNPPLAIAPCALVLAIAVLSTALMGSDLHHRGAAVIDPLTGMLNRKALTNRVSELTQQSEITGAPVGLIVGDLDNFKRVNDTHGHAVGDGALKDVAYAVHKELRAFDLAYRIGGEEFLVLLPGADVDESVEMAEELRAAVEAAAPGDGGVTMSFGVSGSPAGARFDYDAVFAAADAALYAAKKAGRNRVEVVWEAGSRNGHPPIERVLSRVS